MAEENLRIGVNVGAPGIHQSVVKVEDDSFRFHIEIEIRLGTCLF